MSDFYRSRFLRLVSLALMMSLIAPVQAELGGFGRKGKSGMGQGEAYSDGTSMSSDGVERRDQVIKDTGLKAVFPSGFKCDSISSPYASPYRYDGSKRRGDRNSGLHGGIDLSLKNGTPLLAVAAGEVIARGEGGQLEGIFIWLRHAPADTGLPFWTFTKYQHLSVLPELKQGDRVQAGQVIALSGATGTAGRHYGSVGYPHLHLSTHYGPSEQYTIRGVYSSMVRGQDAVIGDPLILYLKGIETLDAVNDLTRKRRKLDIPVVGEDDIIYPVGSTSAWPVRCKRK